MLDYLIAAASFLVLAAFVLFLSKLGREESRRRAAMPQADQARLKADDAEWMQKYGF